MIEVIGVEERGKETFPLGKAYLGRCSSIVILVTAVLLLSHALYLPLVIARAGDWEEQKGDQGCEMMTVSMI